MSTENNNNESKSNYSKRDFGDAGESLAERFLKNKGYRLIAKNYVTKWGEIDLIMEEGKMLVFVEVRRRSSLKYGAPEESINVKKIKHLIKSALVYVMNTCSDKKMVRFDVVSILPGQIRHIPNAFTANDSYYF